MKKIMLIIPAIIIVGLIAVGCSSEKSVFAESGLDKIHVTKLIVTNEVDNTTTTIKAADPISQFFSQLNNIKVKEDKKGEEEAHNSGCNVPGKSNYYVELENDAGKIVGDIRIDKDGTLTISNFENKYVKVVKNEDVAIKLSDVLKNNPN